MSSERSSMFQDPLCLGRTLKERLRSGDACAGAFLKIPSPDMVEVLAGTDLDFVIADCEHGPIGPETCQLMVRAGEACGMAVLARIGESNVDGTVTRFMDTGIAGAHLPHINSVEEASGQFARLFHPSAGSRGLAGGRWARYGAVGPLHALVAELPKAFVVVAQIEDELALTNLESLLQLETPDVYFIGPTDLAASMGLRGDKSEPRVLERVDEAIERITAAGRVAGILAGSSTEAERYAKAGVRYLVFNGEALAQAGASLALSWRKAVVA